MAAGPVILQLYDSHGGNLWHILLSRNCVMLSVPFVAISYNAAAAYSGELVRRHGHSAAPSQSVRGGTKLAWKLVAGP
jgi:hypothetical protein